MMTVITTTKPARVVAEAHTTLLIEDGPIPYDEVVTEGLRVLGESRTSLFGYGVRIKGRAVEPGTELPTGSIVTVYAHRD